jgi:hypothetical protein
MRDEKPYRSSILPMNFVAKISPDAVSPVAEDISPIPPTDYDNDPKMERVGMFEKQFKEDIEASIKHEKEI